jgi:ELWxxDGT repeat protein
MLLPWYRRLLRQPAASTRPGRRAARCRPTLEALEDRWLPSASLALDINTGTLGSNPHSKVDVNGTLFFIADDGVHGYGLWKSDGTEAGTVLVKDNCYGGLTNVKGQLFFVAAAPGPSWGLWKSDGTEAGTVLVKTVSTYSPPFSLTAVHDTLFFVGDNGAHGQELWKSDGTEAGTVLVKNIRPGSTGSTPRNLTAVHDTLFFTANDGASSNELWKSDGTEAGTVLVKNIRPNPSGYSPSSLTAVNGELFFAATDASHGWELWKSDGTQAGTVLVKDIGPNAYPTALTDVQGELFFTADDGVHGRQLWKSDGTEAGTVLVKDINPGGASALSTLTVMAHVHGELYFLANDGTHGRQLWKSDGTEAGTQLVAAIVPGGASAFSSTSSGSLTAVGQTLFFVPDGDRAHGPELWKTDGTEAGTVLVKAIFPGRGSNPGDLIDVKGTLYFSATDALHGATDPLLRGELWKSDGTEAGTALVKAINHTPASSNPQELTDVNGTLFFTVDDGTHGRELWKSTPTANGPVTTLVKDINPGPAPANPHYLTAFRGAVFFAASDGTQTGLWKSDGTEAGTVLVKVITPYLAFYGTFGSSPQRMTVVNDTLYFVATDRAHGYEVWKSDGTTAGTVPLTDLNPDTPDNPGLAPYNLTAVGSTLFFTATDNYYLRGYQLWKSDGTEAGTVMVKYISYGARPEVLTDIGGTLYFTTGGGLWKSDGTEAGTVLVRQTGTNIPSRIIDVNGALFFTTDGFGRELWKSDGTPAGTVLLKSGLDAPRDSANSILPSDLIAVNGRVFFVAANVEHSAQLWTSDGTPEGTVAVEDFFRGSGSASPANLTDVNGELFFTANDGTHGTELWTSDGTAAGTRLAQVIRPGGTGSGPQYLTVVGDSLFFSADDGAHGRQLWAWADDPPVLTPLGDQALPASQTVLTLPLSATSPDGRPLTFSVRAVSLAYQLNQQLGLHTDGGNLWEDWGGRAEKWLLDALDRWYFILPTGELYLWDGSEEATGELVAVPGASCYADPSLLYDAQPDAHVSLTLSGDTLRIERDANFVLGFEVLVTVSDGRLSDSKTFRITVIG